MNQVLLSDTVAGSNYNLRDLMPGESVWVMIPNPSVSASPSLTIACSRLIDGQKIGFDAEVE